jgi:hypothetical protein
MRKTLFIFFALSLLFPLAVQAQSPASASYTPEQLDELAAPIALYPDPLVALILPAATVPGDIVLADRYFEANGDPNQVDNQQWDPSVAALAHYPDVIKWMSDNLDWTTTLGQAFLVEPTQVMESIQQLRAQARANGALVDTPQQSVVMDGSTIEIIPTQPDSICVPEYDPDSVFIAQTVPYSSPIIIFGPPCWVGPWLDYECDWGQYGVWIGTWRPGWDYLHDWRRPRVGANRGNYWRPDPARQRAAQYAPPRTFASSLHPQPMAAAPRPAVRSAQNPARPTYGGYSSRVDTTGWRTDAQGHLAVTPAPAARQAGPQVVLSGTSVANRSASVAPAPSSPSSFNRPMPEVNRPAPTPSPAVNYPTSPFPAGVARPVAPNPGPPPSNYPISPLPDGVARPVTALPPPAPGALFGGYSRGTETRDFSNRGQASFQAARPAAPVMRSAPEAPAPRSEPPPNGGNNDDNRKH